MHISATDARGHTIAGKDLAAARTRAGLSQKQLAELLDHSERIVQKWEANHVAEGKEPLVRAVLGDFLPDAPGVAPLSSYSNWALLMEVGRRLEEIGEGRWKQAREPARHPSGGVPATTPGTGPKTTSDPWGAEEQHESSDEDSPL